jgi:hypothetical protein
MQKIGRGHTSPASAEPCRKSRRSLRKGLLVFVMNWNGFALIECSVETTGGPIARECHSRVFDFQT